MDIGGTFTDFALFDEAGGSLCIHKCLTTPEDPSRAVIEGAVALLERESVDVANLREVVHGTTLVTNAVIERKGARTGMLITEGFRDIPDMREEKRYDVFDLRITFPEPIVARARRREVSERMRYDGTVERPLDLESARSAVQALVREEGIEALAICLLHAYANPAHEEALRRMTEASFPGLFVSTSAEVFLGWREFERFTTTGINAFTGPMFDRYLERIESGLSTLGFPRRLYVMSASGGALTPSACPPPARARHRVGSRRRRADVGGPRPRSHPAEPALLRHGGHHGKRGPGARGRSDEGLFARSRASARVQGRKRAAGTYPGHRHDRDRRRRRQHRGA